MQLDDKNSSYEKNGFQGEWPDLGLSLRHYEKIGFPGREYPETIKWNYDRHPEEP